MISAPRFNSAICSDIPVPPYTHTALRFKDLVNFLHSFPICIHSSRVGVMITAETLPQVKITPPNLKLNYGLQTYNKHQQLSPYALSTPTFLIPTGLFQPSTFLCLT
jgi:hypothetical protein